MENFKKVVHIGSIKPQWTKKSMGVFCKIEYVNGHLSISGVEGPTRSGNARGSCGQIIMGFKEYDKRGYLSLNDIVPAQGWNRTALKRFFDAWDKWHLNDMRAGTKHQEDILHVAEKQGIEFKEWYTDECVYLANMNLYDDDGYKYGTAWLTEAVPEDVLQFLASLPTTDIQPAWV